MPVGERGGRSACDPPKYGLRARNPAVRKREIPPMADQTTISLMTAIGAPVRF